MRTNQKHTMSDEEHRIALQKGTTHASNVPLPIGQKKMATHISDENLKHGMNIFLKTETANSKQTNHALYKLRT